MSATYTYRTRVDGLVHTEPCDTLLRALDRAAKDINLHAPEVEPVRICVDQCIFHYGHILVLLDHYHNRSVGE